jgi:hypothetical protein
MAEIPIKKAGFISLQKAPPLSERLFPLQEDFVMTGKEEREELPSFETTKWRKKERMHFLVYDVSCQPTNEASDKGIISSCDQIRDFVPTSQFTLVQEYIHLLV